MDPLTMDPAAMDPAAMDPAAMDPASMDPAAMDPAAMDPSPIGPMDLPAPTPTPWWADLINQLIRMLSSVESVNMRLLLEMSRRGITFPATHWEHSCSASSTITKGLLELSLNLHARLCSPQSRPENPFRFNAMLKQLLHQQLNGVIIEQTRLQVQREDHRLLKDNLVRSEKQVAQLQDQLRQAREANRTLFESKHGSRHSTEELQRQVEALQAQSEAMGKANAKLQVESETMGKANAELLAQVTELQAQGEAMCKANAEVELRLTREAKRLAETEQRLAETEQRLAEAEQSRSQAEQRITQAEQLVQQLVGEAENVRAEHARALSDLGARHGAEAKQHEKRIKDFEAEYEKLARHVKAQHSQQLRDLAAAHEAESQQLRQEFEANYKALQQELSTVNTTYKALQREYSDLWDKLGENASESSHASPNPFEPNTDTDSARMELRDELDSVMGDWVERESLLNIEIRALKFHNTELTEKLKLAQQQKALVDMDLQNIVTASNSGGLAVINMQSLVTPTGELSPVGKNIMNDRFKSVHKRQEDLKKKNSELENIAAEWKHNFEAALVKNVACKSELEQLRSELKKVKSISLERLQQRDQYALMLVSEKRVTKRITRELDEANERMLRQESDLSNMNCQVESMGMFVSALSVDVPGAKEWIRGASKEIQGSLGLDGKLSPAGKPQSADQNPCH